MTGGIGPGSMVLLHVAQRRERPSFKDKGRQSKDGGPSTWSRAWYTGFATVCRGYLDT